MESEQYERKDQAFKGCAQAMAMRDGTEFINPKLEYGPYRVQG